MKAYLANGLFSESDIIYNDLLAKGLREFVQDIDLYVPQENGDINNKKAYANSVQIFNADKDKLMDSDILIAVIDGSEIDSGVSAEIGLFSSLNKPIYAIYSDSRQQGNTNIKKINALVRDATENQFSYKNLFVVGLIKSSGGLIFSKMSELIAHLSEQKESEGEQK